MYCCWIIFSHGHLTIYSEHNSDSNFVRSRIPIKPIQFNFDTEETRKYIYHISCNSVDVDSYLAICTSQQLINCHLLTEQIRKIFLIITLMAIVFGHATEFHRWRCGLQYFNVSFKGNCMICLELLSLLCVCCVILWITLKKFNKSNESIKDYKILYHILLRKYIDSKIVNTMNILLDINTSETAIWQTTASEDKKSPKTNSQHLNVLTQLSLAKNSNQKRFSSKNNQPYIRSKPKIAQHTQQEIFYIFNDMILICRKEWKYKENINQIINGNINPDNNMGSSVKLLRNFIHSSNSENRNGNVYNNMYCQPKSIYCFASMNGVFLFNIAHNEKDTTQIPINTPIETISKYLCVYNIKKHSINDYIHILDKHLNEDNMPKHKSNKQFDIIYETMTDPNCYIDKRNYRQPETQFITTIAKFDDLNIAMFADRLHVIHCYFIHSVDMGYKFVINNHRNELLSDYTNTNAPLIHFVHIPNNTVHTYTNNITTESVYNMNHTNINVHAKSSFKKLTFSEFISYPVSLINVLICFVVFIILLCDVNNSGYAVSLIEINKNGIGYCHQIFNVFILYVKYYLKTLWRFTFTLHTNYSSKRSVFVMICAGQHYFINKKRNHALKPLY